MGKMELTVGQYGSHLFDMMVGPKREHLDHWESIRAEAEPLVRQLIALNYKMKGGGYEIVGYKDEFGKKKLSKRKRIEKAQEQLWCVKASTLKEGDLVWWDDDQYTYVGCGDPCRVEFVKEEYIGIEVTHCGGEHIEKIYASDIVLKAPDDWEEKEELYSSETYWLEQADKLGI